MNKVHFVLTWKDIDVKGARKKRKRFLRNLLASGLICKNQKIKDINFEKIYITKETLLKYCAILHLKLPIKESEVHKIIPKHLLHEKFDKYIHGSYDIFYNYKDFPKSNFKFTAIYRDDISYLFDLSDEVIFQHNIVSQIIQFILERVPYDKTDFGFGIKKLLAHNVFDAAYPLHDGPIDDANTLRNKLYKEWGAISKFYVSQPIDYIKNYFGVKIGFYFAWLDFYTKMLVLASFFGIICFSCSVIFKDSTIIEEVCESDDITLCPTCDDCPTKKLSNSCNRVKIKHIFDNNTTIFFSIFISLWATMFLELWKRKSSALSFHWNLSQQHNEHSEEPRPEYLAKLEKNPKTINFSTQKEEPNVSFWKDIFTHRTASFLSTTFLALLCLTSILSVALYRMAFKSALFTVNTFGNNPTITNNAGIITSITAACINLILISPLKRLYYRVADVLTEWERWRTQTEFDESYTLKMYILEFINYYGSIFYLAFFKGRFIGYPGNYLKLFSIRHETCDFGGCLYELSIQLIIIMIGKQTINAIFENIIPIIKKFIKKSKLKEGKNKENTMEQWFDDYYLIEWGHRSLFGEYLEMVIQYGFITLFSLAFPLAPFFALLNNIFELRLDGKKLLKYHRRPISEPVKDIGIWYNILEGVAQLSVIVNALIIAFTSDIIPQLVYSYPNDFKLTGYVNFTLSTYRNGTNDFECRYFDYRESEGNLSKTYYEVLAVKIIFVFIFHITVNTIVRIIAACIPDVPNNIKELISAEEIVISEIILNKNLNYTESDDDEEDEDNGGFISIDIKAHELQVVESK